MSDHASRIGGLRAYRLASLAIAALLSIVSHAHGQARDLVDLTVPTVAVHPGTPISAQVLTMRTLPRGAVPHPSGYATTEFAVGKLARRTLLPGQPIPLEALRAPPIIAAGQSVRLIYRSGALQITGEGLAQQAAGHGESVSVRSAQSGVVVRGRVASSRDVVVEDDR
jgi:flagellar basal body P-ring formation protein FlgA